MRRFERLTMFLTVGAASSLLLATGCGGCDDDGEDVDARPPIDAEIEYDAEPTYDAEPPDAAPVSTHSGQLTIADIALAGAPQYGHGMKKFFTFVPYVPAATDPNIIYDDRDAVGAGCVAWVYDLSEDTPPVKEGHGTLTIDGTTGTFPTTGCVFLGADYVCPGASGNADNVTLASAGALGAFTFTDTDAAFVAADAGKYISITAANGMDDYPWNGAFPVIAVMSGTTIVIGNSAPAAQTMDVGGGLMGPGIGITSQPLNDASTYVLVAGEGPVPPAAPGANPPEAIADDDEVVVELNAPDGDAFEDFTTNPIAGGDEFSLTNESLATFVNIPDDGSAFTVECNDDVAHYTGTAGVFAKTNDDVTITHTGQFAAVRVGAEVTISGAATGGNNGTYTITAKTNDTITYVNAGGAAEAFDADTSYAINDCGEATLTGVSMDFNDGDTTRTLATFTGTGPNIVFTENNPASDADDTLTIAHTGEFSPAYFGRYLLVTGATTAGNDGNYYPIINATNDSVTVLAANKTTEGFAAGTTYAVFKPISGLPSLDTATMSGSISCASLTSTAITVVEGAAQALEDVAPTVIQSTFVRSALDIKTNADGTNRTNILVGHGFASFTVTD